MDMRLIINQMAVLFILIAVGYIAGKTKMLAREGVNTLSKIVLNISTPCMILNSVLGNTENIAGGNIAYFMLLVLLAYIIFFLIAIPVGRILGAAPKNSEFGIRNSELDSTQQDSRHFYENPDSSHPLTTGYSDLSVTGHSNSGLYASMIVFGNVGFMGFPVVNAIFGAESLFFAALLNVIFNLLLFSVGIILISGKRGVINYKLLLNATIIAAFISFFIVFTGFRAPKIIADAIGLVSGTTVPCAMLVIGSTLSQIPVREVFTKWQLYPAALLKMVVVPIIIWLVFKQFVTDKLMLGVLTVLSGMPVAAVVAIIPIEYGGDDRTASGSVFLTTLLSAVTIPLIVYLLLM